MFNGHFLSLISYLFEGGENFNCQIPTITLPPQTYPLEPRVVLAWAALGAGGRPCPQPTQTNLNQSSVFTASYTQFQS